MTYMTLDLTRYLSGASGARDAAARIEKAIESGALRSGDRLPAIRDLAESLSVNPATVAAAYRQLRHRGLVHSDGRRGTRVNNSMWQEAIPAVAPLVDQCDLSRGDPDPDLLPDLSAALQAISSWRTSYAGPMLLPELLVYAQRQFAADHIDATAVTVVSGAVDGIEHVLAAHLRPGDRIAVEDPGFGRLLDLARAKNLTTLPVACDDYGADPRAIQAALSAGARALIITPRAQNPFGSVLNVERVRGIRTVLARHPDVVLIEDDHCSLIVDPPAASLVSGHRGPWVVIRSFGKALGPDLRVAVVAGDESTISRIERQLRTGPGWVSQILQAAVVWMLKDSTVSRLLDVARSTYSARRHALLDELRTHGIDAHGASGLNVWIPVRQETPVVQGLQRAGWTVLAGEQFRLASGPAVRATTAALNPNDAARFAADLAALGVTRVLAQGS